MTSELGKPERDEVGVGQSYVQRWSLGKVPWSIGASRCFRGFLRSDAALAELSISCGSPLPLQLAHPAVRLRDFHPFHRLWCVGSVEELFPDGWPVLFQVSRQFLDGHPVDAWTAFVSRRLLIAPFIPLRGPFRPSLLAQLLRLLLTSATGSETISRSSVSNSRPVADLPR